MGLSSIFSAAVPAKLLLTPGLDGPNAAYVSLAGFAALATGLLGGIVGRRMFLVMTKKAKPESFNRGVERDALDIHKRLEVAHSNILETLPIYGAIVLAASQTGNLATANAIAGWMLLCRVLHTATILATPVPCFRIPFFFGQLGMMLHASLRLIGRI